MPTRAPTRPLVWRPQSSLLEMERIYITVESELSLTSSLVDQLLQAVERYGELEGALRSMVMLVQDGRCVAQRQLAPPPCATPSRHSLATATPRVPSVLCVLEGHVHVHGHGHVHEDRHPLRAERTVRTGGAT